MSFDNDCEASTVKKVKPMKNVVKGFSQIFKSLNKCKRNMSIQGKYNFSIDSSNRYTDLNWDKVFFSKKNLK